MEILVLTREFPPYVLGGISYHLKEMYNRIQERGHNVTIIAGRCPQSWNELANEVNPDIKVVPVQFGYRKGYYLLYPVAARAKLSQIDVSKFDVAITHTPLPYQIPDLPVITKYHDCVSETRPYIRNGLSFYEKIGDSILHPFRKYIDQKSLQHSNRAIFNSRINREAWEDNYGVDIKSEVIYNGVDTQKFFPSIETGDYLLFVGSSERKGLSEVLDYAEQSDHPIHIVGEVDSDHDNVIIHGRVTQQELRDLYSGAIATIHPTRFEAFGNVILESLACDTPVITTDKCGAAEILTKDVGVIIDDLRRGSYKIPNVTKGKCREVAGNYLWGDVANQTISTMREMIH